MSVAISSMIAGCPFCDIANSKAHERVLDSNDFGFLIRDGFPVTEGHSLIIPKRHAQSFFELSLDEREALLALLDSAKVAIDHELSPDSYTIGINDGPAAGQTIPHVHIHLIPRYEQENSDPRGGVRWVIPEKADYWSER